MTFDYLKKFLKNYQKRILPNPKLNNKLSERLEIFMKNPADPQLKDHGLTGKKKAFRSFSITGDIRVVYKIEGDIIRLYDIGSHNQVY